MDIIASEEIFFRSPSPEDLFCYTPALTRLPGGRLLALFDLGGPGGGENPEEG